MLYLSDKLPICFSFDKIGIIFAAVVSIVFAMGAVYSLSYMREEEHKVRYYVCYGLVFLILIALCASGNLITYYLFYEMMTLVSVPLVLHEQDHSSVMAGLKYLLYSLFGAYMVLFGLFFVYKYSDTLNFTVGGVLNRSASDHRMLLLASAFLMVMGFSVKAGMFPMHAWLPTAHPVAPSPASAVLSAVIVKAGVLGIVRVIFYVFGSEFISGTWVQNILIILSLLTVFMGSMLAYRTKIFKKRLAYSTVSQVSYILFGLFTLNPVAETGAILHVIAHAFIKCTLFLVAGALIHYTGLKNVDDYRGIGRKMPVLLWCYTLVSLGLIGIPPTGGFISKWYLAEGAIMSGIPVFRFLGPVILLVSALLTAGYLLPVTMRGFFPGEQPLDEAVSKLKEPDKLMLIPIIVLTILSVVIGMFPGGIVNYIQSAVNMF